MCPYWNPSSLRVGLTPLFLVMAGMLGCVSPSPSRTQSPDVELAALLEDLQRLRGGSFDGGGEESYSSLDAQRDQAGEIGLIEEDLRGLALTFPAHVPTLVANAALAYERRDAVRAQKYLDQALFQDPIHLAATLLRVRIASEAGNLPYARRKLKELIQVLPDSPEAHEAYSGVLYLAGDYEEATQTLDLVDRLRGDETLTWRTSYHRGLIAEAQGHFDEANAHYQHSQSLSPGFTPAARRSAWLTHREPEVSSR